MMAEEKRLSPSGRYTLVYVIIPHYPLKLRSDCSYSVGSTTTEPLEQSQCALKLLLKFVGLLKDLGRFDDSLILINGDHGGPYRTQDGELVTMARSRSLDAVLMVKPVGTPAGGELQVSDLETSLLMIPSIVMSSVADAVAVVVSSGPPVGPNLMPNFVGRDVVEVTEWLERNQLPISSIHEVPHAIAPKGMVVSQSPRAGFRTDGDVEFIFQVGKGN